MEGKIINGTSPFVYLATQQGRKTGRNEGRWKEGEKRELISSSLVTSGGTHGNGLKPGEIQTGP